MKLPALMEPVWASWVGAQGRTVRGMKEYKTCKTPLRRLIAVVSTKQYLCKKETSKTSRHEPCRFFCINMHQLSKLCSGHCKRTIFMPLPKNKAKHSTISLGIFRHSLNSAWLCMTLCDFQMSRRRLTPAPLPSQSLQSENCLDLGDLADFVSTCFDCLIGSSLILTFSGFARIKKNLRGRAGRYVWECRWV